jgi:hypothetical protein
LWVGAHPPHINERALFEAHIGSSFSNIQIRAFLVIVRFHLLFIVTSVSRVNDCLTCHGKLGSLWASSVMLGATTTMSCA